MTKSILLVDDDKILTFITVNSIKKLGLVEDIQVAYNGKEAIDLLTETIQIPDFILLDINMPIMDGFDFLDQYYKLGLNGKSKIAIYTSSIQEADKEKANKYGDVFDFIIKPLSPERLEKIILELN